MSDTPSVLMAEIQQKVARLAADRDAALTRCSILEERIAALRSDLSAKEEELRKASLEIEFLILSHRLASTPQALADARRTVAGLIRKVDSAIALIKSDPAEI